MREEPDEDLLHEMAFSWTDIEKRLKTQSPNVYEALQRAYRVEAVIDANNWGDPQTIYDLYFDAADEASRSAARVLKDADKAVESAIKAFVDVWDSQESYERFAEQRLDPAVDKVAGERGFARPTMGTDTTTIHDVHRVVLGKR